MLISSFPTSRFQFERTRPLRAQVYRQARLALRSRILEVGSGEGPVALEMARRTGRTVLALDRAPGPALPGVLPVAGDARHLPFASASLDAVAFHFVLLWLEDPVASLREARRVLAPGGVLLVLAEPDLVRRTEEPETGLGALLARAVREAGGSPAAGAEVGRWLAEAGFRPHLAETPPEPSAVRDPAELLWECDFLDRCGAEASAVRRAVEAHFGAGDTVRVTLPVTYGWASPERG